MNRDLKNKIRYNFVAKYGHLASNMPSSNDELKEAITNILDGIVNSPRSEFPDADREKLVLELMDEFAGFGPIEKLMKDSDVTEIMINGPKKVYVERKGKKELSGINFDSEEHVMSLINKMLMFSRRRVDESFPYTDLSLDDGSRVNIIISPVVLGGPVVTIRKFLKDIRSIDDLIGLDTLDKRMGEFLLAAIRARMNIVLSGATGSGKTTTLNVLASYIPNDERIITIEDTAELRLDQEHVIRLQAKQANIEGKGEITIRNLFNNSLRMRPKRIIIGEIRGAEALDMLQAICSGHGGSLAVIHADNPQDVLYRIETMILISGVPISLEVISRQVSSAINIILHQQQLPDGSRKIVNITAVNGLKNNQVVLDDIFIYDIENVSKDNVVTGKWFATGVVPIFYDKFMKAGVMLPKEIFNKG